MEKKVVISLFTEEQQHQNRKFLKNLAKVFYFGFAAIITFIGFIAAGAAFAIVMGLLSLAGYAAIKFLKGKLK